MDIVELFNGVSERMRSDLNRARAVMDHPGLKGASFEEAFRRFLREYLPARLDVSTGIVVDCHGNSSRQIDVIISDAGRTPILYSNGEDRVVPIEGVYAAIEIKANLTLQELDRCFENMKSLRQLQRDAQLGWGDFIRTYTLYGEQWEEAPPAHFFVFAYDSVSLESLTHKLNQLHQSEDLPLWQRIDTICVLNEGVILNQKPEEMFDALPSPGSTLGYKPTDKALLLFYTLISHYLFQERKPPMQFSKYLGKLEF